VVVGFRVLWWWCYDAAGRLQTSVDAQNRETQYQYDARGRLRRITYADDTSEVTTYGTGSLANLVVQTTDRAGHITSYGYDGDGRRTSVTTGAEAPATQVVESITYLPGTTLEASRSGGGRQVTYTYDAQQRRIATATRVNATTVLTETVTYDSADRIDHTTDAYGRRTYIGYDSQGRQCRVVRELVVGGLATTPVVASLPRITTDNPPYLIEDTEYDLADQVIARHDAAAVRSEFHLDERDRIHAVVQAAGTSEAATTTTAYDATGNVVDVTSPGGRRVHNTYTQRNLLETRTEGYGTAVAGTTSYTYTLTGKVQSQTDPNGHAVTYGYGSCCDYLVSVTDQLQYQTTFGRNGLGQLTTFLDADGRTGGRTYDALGRVLTEYRNNAGVTETTTYLYDDCLSDSLGLNVSGPVATRLTALGLGVVGRAVQVTRPEGDSSYVIWDGAGREVCRIDALGVATTTSYDTVVSALVETAQTDALSHTVRSRSDAAGRARVSVDALGKTSSAVFSPQGYLKSSRDANGSGMDATYDLRGRQLTSTMTRLAGPPQTITRSWDADGNLLQARDAVLMTTTHTYDARNRRETTTDRIAALTTFDYDLVGNLRHITDAEDGVTTYTYTNRNELESETLPPPTGGIRSYTYWPGGALRTRADQRGILTTYRYDGVSRLRFRDYSDSASDEFTYDRNGQLTTAISGRFGTTVAWHYKLNGLL
jgi:YD repeat-containing protein